jgi:uroporphyrin-III C-methyltransferase/precorrin-2 dehydrogenase/sirohydrochlorin ferrochelatase
LPDLVARIDRGPAILVIGDVVAHSTSWRDRNFTQTLSKLLEAAE